MVPNKIIYSGIKKKCMSENFNNYIFYSSVLYIIRFVIKLQLFRLYALVSVMLSSTVMIIL